MRRTDSRLVMAIVVFQHDAGEGTAVLGATLRDCGHQLRVIRLDRGDSVPTHLRDVHGVLSMGGPMNVDQHANHPWLGEEITFLKTCFDAGMPIVGVCLGAQLLAVALGGEVQRADAFEFGWHTVRLGFPGTIDPIYAGVRWESTQFHMHGHSVSTLPPGATPLAASKMCPIQAFRVGLKTYGVQYHFEWSESDIAAASTAVAAGTDGLSGQTALDQLGQFYADYRRLGNRLCRNIGTLLY